MEIKLELTNLKEKGLKPLIQVKCQQKRVSCDKMAYFGISSMINLKWLGIKAETRLFLSIFRYRCSVDVSCVAACLLWSLRSSVEQNFFHVHHWTFNHQT
jgi:hypothetical protein